MILDYGVDGRPRQVATVNVDFMVNTLTWRLKNIRHPESGSITSIAIVNMCYRIIRFLRYSEVLL